MNHAVVLLLLFTFTAGIAVLLLLVWVVTRSQLGWSRNGASVIFDHDEVGTPEEPAGEAPQQAHGRADDLLARRAADLSSRKPVLMFLASAIFWLLVGSIAGLVVSLKATFPSWLNESAWLTFGRLRPFHLNAVAYGFASMAGMGVALWLVPRIVRTPLEKPRWLMASAVVWNIGVAAGLLALLAGWTDGIEWLEFPWQIDLVLVVAGGLAGVPFFATLRKRKVDHLYVSIWYMGAAFVWFPMLFLVANLPWIHFGVEHATVNWWFAHNTLGLWLTPLGLASAYYFIPKVIGRPIHSYGLSLIGFWSLALFYSQVGMHHLIGGPVPTWLVTVSIVHSVMMVVPVVAVAVNHHVTMVGHFGALRRSPTLRFMVFGAVSYTLTSLEGSLQSLRSINRVTHFTHFTVGHAHFGVYGFVAMVLFGGMYFLLPRLAEREWPHPRLIAAHFWGAVSGILVYVVALSVGGILQGLAMLDPKRPFMDSVAVTIPYLHARTIGGLLMTLSHFVFAWHTFALLRKRGEARVTAARPQPAIAIGPQAEVTP